MGFVGSVLGAGSTTVAAGGSALTGSDPYEVLRQIVRPVVVRRRNRCWDDVPLSELQKAQTRRPGHCVVVVNPTVVVDNRIGLANVDTAFERKLYAGGCHETP